ncbi:MAG: hypothetical protein HC861_07205 [Rhodospirillaceae bacterium]|nr:hypothetical protein [Rhodospirillaceae bacterium]
MPLIRLLCLVALVAFAAPALADEPKIASTTPSPELLAKLKAGGYLIYFRHAKTPNYKDPHEGDPDDPQPGNCSNQRNLSVEGIEQSRALGQAFRDLEIPYGIVRASPYCRCMDTAWHAFGRFERDRTLLLHGTEPDKDPPEGKIWRDIRNLAKLPPLPGTNSMFVSHGTVGEVFGAGYLDEGEAVIVKPDGKGGWSLIARVKSDQWPAPAR